MLDCVEGSLQLVAFLKGVGSNGKSLFLKMLTEALGEYAYDLPSPPNRATIEKLAEPWRPYRAWAMVILHMWLRREGGPSFKRPGRQGRARSRS